MGGTYDAKTGQIVWEMRVPLADQLVHYRAHPPRAIRELVARPTEVDFQFDGHGEPVNGVFELACPCGGTLFTATCGVEIGEQDNEVCPPIGIECDACGAAFEIFDASAHGWNAELCGDGWDEPEEFDELFPDQIELPHEMVVRFEYGSEILGDPAYAGREHDIFSWFTLLARDATSQRVEQLFDFECA